MAATNFASDVVILQKKDIAKLTDEQLVDKYMDAVVELEANKTFHQTNGFAPKDYKEYKDLIKFRLVLLMEIHGRNMEIPQFDRSF
jgi:Ni2+-binding GTPase involved in maturation of urease and hydrogenase